MKIARALGVATSVAFVLTGCQGQPAREPAPATELLERVLTWLPEDTQTLIVATDIVATEAAQDGRAPVEARLAEIPLNVLGTVARAEDMRRLGERLGGRKVILGVQGARRFRSPTALGLMTYEGGQVLVFDADLGTAGEQLWEALKKDAQQMFELEGRAVAEFQRKLEEDVWTYYVVRPFGRIVLTATDRGYLLEMLRRMVRSGPGRALPESLPEWQQLDRTARVWAIRHYDPADAELDPSSPLRGPAPANRPDPKAVGLVFYLDPARPRAIVKYLSGADDGVRVAASLWRHRHADLDPEIRQRTAGVVEIAAVLEKERGSEMFWFVLLAALGHGIYL